jgi:hypothetical protein
VTGLAARGSLSNTDPPLPLPPQSLAARFSVSPVAIAFAGPDGAVLPLETPVGAPVTADFTAFVTDASGCVTAWQLAFTRGREGGGGGGGDAFVPGPRLTTEELEAPVSSAAAVDADYGYGDAGSTAAASSYEARDAAAVARHAGLGSITAAGAAGTANAAAAADAGPPSPADFDIGLGHMHTVGGSGGPAVEFDETDLVASGTGRTAEQRPAWGGGKGGVSRR